MVREKSLAEKMKSMNVEDKAITLYVLSASGESFRGGVLLGAAHLDELLTRLLCHFMIQEKSMLSLFTGSGALYEFKAKIEVAYGFGLISQDEHHDLEVIRKIRNTIAHTSSLEEEEDSIRDRAQNLISVPDNEKAGKSIGETMHHAMAAMILHLCARIRKSTPRTVAPELEADDFW